MAKITTEETRQLGYLARIFLSDEEAGRLQSDLDRIVEYVAQLQSIETEGIERTNQVTGLTDVVREDVVTSDKDGLSREDLLANAPATENGYIKVRRVLA